MNSCEQIRTAMMAYDWIGFDLFDTLLLRPFLQPDDLFCQMEQELQVPDFAALRSQTENQLRQGRKRELTFLEIYQAIQQKTGVSDAVIQQWMDLELELEWRYCYPRESGLSLYCAAKEAGKHIAIVTDMYLPNPKRLRDWLSVPKSNGYESLHITVMGPEGKWVEVQIRTERMDEIAEKGLAAHWRYKGVKGESGLDEWLNSIRETLENADSDMEAMDQFKLDLYKDEVFVFTPKGDLYKLPQGATVLDFAFTIHTNIGCRCIGAKVNGKNAQVRQPLVSGDQVEIMTSSAQTPKQDWLNFVTTSKARTKIRQALKEIAAKQTQFARETLERKFKNRKIEYDEAILMRLIKKLGYKTVTDFYRSISDESLDINILIDRYVEMQRKETEQREEISYRSAEGFNIQQATEGKDYYKDDVLVIDQNLKGIDFNLAKCCNPIYGDEVFGFVTISGGIKIHRCDCPNAKEMRARFPYRIVRARWAGKSQGKQYPIRLRVVGHDDIGIVTNITSIINKETNILLRSISIDSNDGLFSGMLTVMVDDNTKLESLIKKIKTVKGVKQVSRG